MAEEKNTKLNGFILVFYLFSDFHTPTTMEFCFPRDSRSIAPPLHTSLHLGRLFLVGCCVENHQSAVA